MNLDSINIILSTVLGMICVLAIPYSIKKLPETQKPWAWIIYFIVLLGIVQIQMFKNPMKLKIHVRDVSTYATEPQQTD